MESNTRIAGRKSLLKKALKYAWWALTFRLQKKLQEINTIDPFQAEMKLVKESGLFDIDWYLKHNPDVKEAAVDPVEHFLKFGYREGRNPNEFFDTAWYNAVNNDVAQTKGNPFIHFLKYGAYEGRNPNPDSQYYEFVRNNPDKEVFGINPFHTYLWASTSTQLKKHDIAPHNTTFPENLVKSNNTYLMADYKSAQFYRIIYVSGFPDSSSHNLRVNNQIETLRECSISSAWIKQSDCARFSHMLSFAEIIVLFRVALTEEISQMVDKCKKAGCLVVYDTDDYVFDPEIANEKFVDGIRFLPKSDIELYHKGVIGYKEAATLCDAGIFTTSGLANAMQNLNKPSFIIRNTVTERFYNQTKAALQKKSPNTSSIINIGYASGSLTHQKDFQKPSKAIAKILGKHENVRLYIVGLLKLEEFPELSEYKDKITTIGLLPPDGYTDELMNFDINIAPLEVGNPFCEAKSELKYFEAALLKIPTIASPTEPYKYAITEGQNGFFAESEEEWFEKLEALILSPKMRFETSNNAYRDALLRYGQSSRKEQVFSVFSELFKIRKEKYLNNYNQLNQTITFLTSPIDKGSGGHANIIDMAKWLAKWGHSVTIAFTHSTRDYPTPAKIEQDFNFDITSLRASFNDDLPADTNVVFATYWSTVYNVEKNTKQAGRRYYLLLDYEPYFFPMGTEYIMAMNTYYKDFRKISYGDWIKNLLRVRHNIHDVRTFPNYINRHTFEIKKSIVRKDKKIAFFGRPNMARRCFDLGMKALQRYRELYGDAVEIVIYGSPALKGVAIPFKHTLIEVLKPLELADLYCSSTLGIAFSPTNPSRTPYEMMSCGLPVMDLKLDENEINYGGAENVFLVAPDIDTIAHTINKIMNNKLLREKTAANGKAYADALPDEETSAREIYKILQDDIKS